MSYCRFRNTINDLADCLDYIDKRLPKDEHDARKRLVSICKQIADADDMGDIPSSPKGENEDEDDS